MKAIMKSVVSYGLILALISSMLGISCPQAASAAKKYTDVACYAPNAKLTDPGKNGKVSLKGNQIVVKGWLYTERNGWMKWIKNTRKFKITSKTDYMMVPEKDTADGKKISKKRFVKEMKEYGTKYDTVNVFAINGKANMITLQCDNNSIVDQEKVDIGEAPEMMVYAKGCIAHQVGEVCPQEYGKISISGNNLVIEGMITTNFMKRIKKGTYQFPIKQKLITAKLKKNMQRFNSRAGKNPWGVFNFTLNEKGEVSRYYFGSGAEV